jgi:hypothetical protein
MITTVRTLALCATLFILGSFVEAGSAIDVFSRKFDEFHGAKWEDAMARLDNFALSMQTDPNSVGIVFVYGGQRRRPGEARAWTTCIKDYLVNRRRIVAKRLVMINGGYLPNLTVELWQAPDINHIPKPAPHIERKGVRFKGSRIRRWRSLCNI